jgi:hypothetical protein
VPPPPAPTAARVQQLYTWYLRFLRVDKQAPLTILTRSTAD